MLMEHLWSLAGTKSVLEILMSWDSVLSLMLKTNLILPNTILQIKIHVRI